MNAWWGGMLCTMKRRLEKLLSIYFSPIQKNHAREANNRNSLRKEFIRGTKGITTTATRRRRRRWWWRRRPTKKIPPALKIMSQRTTANLSIIEISFFHSFHLRISLNKSPFFSSSSRSAFWSTKSLSWFAVVCVFVLEEKIKTKEIEAFTTTTTILWSCLRGYFGKVLVMTF